MADNISRVRICFLLTSALCATFAVVSTPTFPGLEIASVSFDESETGGIGELRVSGVLFLLILNRGFVNLGRFQLGVLFVPLTSGR